MSGTILLGKRFDRALLYAASLHYRQVRKGTRIPYLSHLLAVSAIVLENGGNEDQAIAALLHDAVEDQGGIKTLEQIRTKFGEAVPKIVPDCSDSFDSPKPPWKARKIEYLEHLVAIPDDSALVSLADKVHNARSILNDLKQSGDETWERFSGKKVGTLWYYRKLVDVFKLRKLGFLTDELTHIVNEIEVQALQDE